MKTETKITIRCKAFTGYAAAVQQVIVESDGECLVYDDVAGHYTRCHSMSEKDMARARKLAAKKVTA